MGHDHKGALDLAPIQHGVQGLADVVQNAHPVHSVFSGQQVDADLRDGRAL